MKMFILLFVFIILRGMFPVYPCSMVYVPPVRFDPDEYIFIGEVAAYTGALYSDSLERSFQGLRILIKEVVYLPVKNPGIVDIIPYDLGPACELMSTDEKSLELRYPLGTQLRIVGKESVFIQKSLSDLIILDINPYKMFTLSRNITDPSILMSSLSTVYDYRYACSDSVESFKESLHSYDQDWAQSLVNSFAQLVDFELRKDLYRLSIATADEDRSAIITRLIDFKHYIRDSLLLMIDNNVKNPSDKEKLIKLVDKVHPEIIVPQFDTSLHTEIPDSMTSEWTQTNGPYGGSIVCLAETRTSSGEQLLFAGTSRNGVYRSIDRGSWIKAGKEISNQGVKTLFVDKNDIYASTDTGNFKSTDYGNTWKCLNKGFPLKRIFGARAFTSNGKYIFAAMSSNGVFRSSDHGNTWVQVSSGLGKNGSDCLLAYKNYLFAGNWGGIFVSTDNGNNWRSLNDSLPVQQFLNKRKSSWFPIKTIFMSGKKIFIGTEFIGSNYNGLYASNDFGKTWELADSIFYRTRIFSISGDSSNLFVSTEKGIYYSKNNGKEWSFVNNILKNHGSPIRLLYIEPNLYAAALEGLFSSTNQGKNWKRDNSGLINTEVNGITSSGSALAAGIYQQGIFYSSDNGSTWISISDSIESNRYANLTHLGNNILFSSYDGLYLSKDSGVAWSKILDQRGQSIQKVFVHDNIIFVYSDLDVLCSADTGRHWNTCRTRILVKDFGELGSRIFIAHQKGIIFSSDEGSTWEISELIPERYVKIFFNIGSRIGALIESRGVMISPDSGKSWVAQTDSIYFYQFENIAVSGSYLFAGTWNLGVVFSADEGKTWIPFNYGLEDRHILSLTIKDDFLYAGTTSGVWKHPLIKQ